MIRIKMVKKNYENKYVFMYLVLHWTTVMEFCFYRAFLIAVTTKILLLEVW